MRPDCFYELTDGCELTFADIRCQYVFGPPPDRAEEEEEEGDMSGEQTQAYDVLEGGEGGEEDGTEKGEEHEDRRECYCDVMVQYSCTDWSVSSGHLRVDSCVHM